MLDYTDHDQIVEISMNRPPVNAMNQVFVDALNAAIAHYASSGVSALVLSGRDGLFSAGLDVPELLQLDKEAINQFWTSFFALMHSVASCPVPVVAALTGHSPGGGAVLALHCDYRIATAGKFKIGLNEVQVGLPVPRNILHALEHAVGSRKASQLASSGALLSPEEALDAGMIDELAAPGEAVGRSIEWLQAMLELPAVAMNKTRLAAKSVLLDSTAQNVSYARIATDYWFSDETQMMLKQLVASLEK
jgi:3,2-trans-enoyl-CoA isomerase